MYLLCISLSLSLFFFLFSLFRPLSKPSPLFLLPIPHPRNLGISHLPLQLEDPVHQRLARRRAAGNIHIDRHDPVATSHHAVAVVVVSTAVGTRTHGDHPARVRHLVVHLAQRGRHLVGQRAGHNHHVGLAGRGTENDAETVLVVARGGEVHHFHGAASQTEGHGPEGALTRPVGYDIKCGPAVQQSATVLPLTNTKIPW